MVFEQAAATNIRGDSSEGEDDQQAFLDTLTSQELDELRAMVDQDHIYARLVASIAPTVYGEFERDEDAMVASEN